MFGIKDSMANQDFDLLFLGGLFPKELEKEVIVNSKGNIQSAANNLQWSLLDGFNKNLKSKITVFNLMFIGSFPLKYKKFHIKSSIFKITQDFSGFNIGFFNLIGLKNVSKKINLYRHLDMWLRSSTQNKAVYIYSVQNIWLDSIKRIKKRFPEVHISLMIPDLPSYTMMGKSNLSLHGLYRFYLARKTQQTITNVDSLVFLTKKMNDFFRNKKPFIVLEGIAPTIKKRQESSKLNNTKAILYSGALTKNYGIVRLISAFSKIDNDSYELWICGSGEESHEVEKLSQIDSRVKYFGVLEHQEVLRLQRQATVLVNPRLNLGEYTKYSFPSKILEYMAIGKPIVMYKLDGVPDEYDEFLIYPDSEDIISLQSTLVRVCELSEDDRDTIGTKAQEFVFNQKNSEVQVKKIIELISRCIEN